VYHLPGVRLTSVTNSDRCWKEYHLDYNICLVSPSSKGVGANYTGRGCHSAGPGDLIAFEPGDHHVTTRVSGGPACFDLIGIDPAEMERAMAELRIRGRFQFRSPHMKAPDVARALVMLVHSAASGGSGLELESRYATFLQKLVAQCAEPSVALRRPEAVRHSGIRAARNYLRDNPHENPSLADLAQMAGLTRFAFAHAFTQHVGLPAHTYLKLRRACEARRLVEFGVPIVEVASRLGYVDVPLLTRTLKAHFGAPPARWRRCLQRNSQGPSARSASAG
jgi:AraC-like DNA-binding protein